MMELKRFQEFLTVLRDQLNCQVCGSMARGNYDIDHLSDIDLVVDANRSDIIFPKAINIFKQFDVPGVSILIGQWSTPRDTTTLPRPVEIMSTMWMEPEKYPTEEVVIFGVIFKTFRKNWRTRPKEF